MKQLGIIGVGHLGSSLLKGLIHSGKIAAKDIIISGGKSGKTQQLSQQLGCQFSPTNHELAQKADIIILAVIPSILPNVLDEINDSLKDDTIIISTAASFTLAQIYQYIQPHIAVIRAIANIPSTICQGMTAITPAKQVLPSQLNQVIALFELVGKIALVDEAKLDISSTVTGCSPAYIALFIEALADAGVLAGLSREESYFMSKQAVLGSASLLLEQNMLPADLKDRVCSPGGTTIRGIAALEKWGLRHAVIEAVKASAKITE